MNKSLKIAVLDDDDDDFLIFKDFFEESSIKDGELLHFKTPTQLLEYLEQCDLDICFVDYKLGETYGTDVIISLSITYPRMPCVLLTGVDDHKIDIEAMQAGARDYLSKDKLNAVLLERTIRYTLNNNSQLDQFLEERQRLERILELSPYPTMFFDETGNLRMISHSLQTYCGYGSELFNTVEEWFKLVHVNEPKNPTDFLKNLINSETEGSYECWISNINKKRMYWRFKTVEIGRSRQGLRLFVTMATDITNLANAIEMIRASL